MQRNKPTTLRHLALPGALASALFPGLARAGAEQEVAPTIYLSPAPDDGAVVLVQGQPGPVPQPVMQPEMQPMAQPMMQPMMQPAMPMVPESVAPPSRVRVRMGLELAVHSMGSPYRRTLELYTGAFTPVSSRFALSTVVNVVGPFVLGARVGFGGGDFGALSFNAAPQSLFTMDFSAQAGVLWRGGNARHRGSVGLIVDGGLAYGSLTLRNTHTEGALPRVAANVEGGYHGRVGERTWLGFSLSAGLEYMPWHNVGDRGLDLVLGGPIFNLSLELVR